MGRGTEVRQERRLPCFDGNAGAAGISHTDRFMQTRARMYLVLAPVEEESGVFTASVASSVADRSRGDQDVGLVVIPQPGLRNVDAWPRWRAPPVSGEPASPCYGVPDRRRST